MNAKRPKTRLPKTRHPKTGRGTAALLLALAVLPAVTAVPGPASAQLPLLVSEEEEAKIGKEEHPQILAQFGGAYDNPALAKYVDSIGQLLLSTTEKPNQHCTFTVLNTAIVNAFAMPGCYVYVTRGLLGLAGNEAELAGVMAHELGHVMARHFAQRQSQSMIAGLGLGILSILTGNQLATQVGSLTANLVLKSYSREQESEADSRGVRYMSRAGFDPQAMATFLTKLQANDKLQATIMGDPGAADRFSLLQTHPRTADRVQAAIQEASAITVPNPIVERDIYLSKIDGIVYGDSPDDGVVRGQEFIHPKLGFRFEVPSGFQLINSDEAVLAMGPNNAEIQFMGVKRPPRMSMQNYLTSVVAKGGNLQDVEALNIGGMEAATGHARAKTDSGVMDARIVAIAFDADTIYQFVFLTPPGDTQKLSEGFRRTTYSFRRITEAEAKAIRPLRIHVVTAAPGDTVESLAKYVPFESYAADRLRVLNGLAPNEDVSAGEKVKVVEEDK